MTMGGDGLALARRLLAAGDGRYGALRAATEARVVAWEGSDGPRYSLEPGRFLAWRTRRGRSMAVDREALGEHEHAYGFDAAGRLVLTRIGGARAGEREESFYEHAPNRVVRYDFGARAPKRLAAVTSYTHSDDPVLMLAIDGAHRSGRWTAFRYRYEGERLVEATLRRGSSRGEQVDFRDFEYDEEGRLAAVWWRYPDGRREAIALAGP